jgi:small subunit ribosomal protein S20
MRSSARKQLHNRTIKTRLHTVEKNFLQLVGTGKKDEATKALAAVSSALDKAAKTGKIHKSRASRKKSRLALQLNKLK